MKASELPAGYMIVNGVTLHVAELRKHTSDLQRFTRLLPYIERLTGLAPGSAEAERVRAAALRETGASDRELVLTLRESAALAAALADELDGAA